MAEEFTREEQAALAPYFTNLDGPVFALVDLPEVVKGALFARYSRSPKSLRRLFLDEFATGEAADHAPTSAAVSTERAEQLYERVFFEYGDDSVAQLGGVHLAVEQASQPRGDRTWASSRPRSPTSSFCSACERARSPRCASTRTSCSSSFARSSPRS